MCIKLYATRERGSFITSDAINLRNKRVSKTSTTHILCNSQRPDLMAECKDLKEYGDKGLIYVCGPEGMVDDCATIAYKYGSHLKRETFLL